MQRISVDLPEPDGPMTTTTSWRPTVRSMPRSAWNAEPLLDALAADELVGGPVGRRRAVARRLGGRLVGDAVGHVCSHRTPTPKRRSSRWLSRDIV